MAHKELAKVKVRFDTWGEGTMITVISLDDSNRESSWNFECDEEAEKFVIEFRQMPCVTVVEEIWS